MIPTIRLIYIQGMVPSYGGTYDSWEALLPVLPSIALSALWHIHQLASGVVCLTIDLRSYAPPAL